MPGAINSAVVLVGQMHIAFLEEWAKLLKTPAYQFAQSQSVRIRDPLMLGDQDAISALVASKKYESLNIQILMHPIEILHHQGVGSLNFAQRMKLKNAENLPSIIHAMASTKPWMMKRNISIFGNFHEYYTRIFLELSPYVWTAKKYKNVLTEDITWLKTETIYSKIMLLFFRENPIAAGFIQSLIHELLKFRK